MNLLQKLKQQAAGAVAQVNPLDGGKTYQSVARQQAPPQRPQPRQQQPMGYGQPTNYGSPMDGMVDTPQGYVGNANPQFLQDGNGYGAPIGQLQVQPGGYMQPYGGGYEDEFTAETALQPVRYNSGQTSLNGNLQQGNNGGNLQGMKSSLLQGLSARNKRIR